jgi:hypothetical protein
MYEPVYTVIEYYDGPRRGIADYQGAPHLYESRWSDIETDGPDTFLVMPVSHDTFKLALEDWAIFQRWEAAFHRGQTAAENCPALPEDSARQAELEGELRSRLVIDESRAFCAVADFKAQDTDTEAIGLTPLVVEWSIVACKDSVDNRGRFGSS